VPPAECAHERRQNKGEQNRDGKRDEDRTPEIEDGNQVINFADAAIRERLDLNDDAVRRPGAQLNPTDNPSSGPFYHSLFLRRVVRVDR
jgi:hypothetical protein